MRERATKDAQGTCAVCGDRFPRADLVPAEMVRPAVAEMIRAEVPSWSDADAICARDHARFRARQVQSLLKEEIGELGDLEREVVEVLGNQSLLAANTQAEFDRSLSFGERIADRVARFGGSWAFILSFLFLLAAWIAVNSVLAFRKPFDPFPFILLNLILSCVAALQAPVIMMSQNRQEAKDRLRAENDYQVNLKAELEIRMLSKSVDGLLHHQWRRLLEIQQIQIDLMEELARARRGSAP
ncbi:MAG TPA: DUF1003 domain-containing protein [Thermoanaerobaculia bacterium]|nr:DUF1003 domain-containing protein [Thermoanaerobaculia bacterium]